MNEVDSLALPYLPTPVIEIILTYVDIPTLGSAAQACHRFNEVTWGDSVWCSHLELLLKELYDNCGKPRREGDLVVVVPLSKRPLKSTEVARWFNDHYKHILGYARPATAIKEMPLIDAMRQPLLHQNKPNCKDSICLLPQHYQWFWRAVPLRQYYHQAAGWAIWSEFQYFTYEMTTEDKCAICLTNGNQCAVEEDCCLCGYYVMERFCDVLHNHVLKGLPSIRLFRSSLPNMTDQSDKEFFQRWPSASH